MSIGVGEADFFGWRGIKIEAGDTAVGIVPQIGGRIISLKHKGEEVLYAHLPQAGETYAFEGVADLREMKKRMGFGLWGGDKTWVAPQSAWWEAVPPLELDAGPYSFEIDGASISMTSLPCRETGLRIARKIRMTPDGAIVLDQTFVNESQSVIERGIWGVTQAMRPFDVYIPIEKSALRPYPEEGASVELFGKNVFEENGWAKIVCDRPAHFKFGGVAERGVVVAMRKSESDALIFARRFETDPNARYAHGSSVEVYNSPDYNYLEIEVHAPLSILKPGEKASHRQTWKVFRAKSDAGLAEIEKLF